MNVSTWRVGLLLFGSGSCALIYQTVWLRQFRLIFGASTAASAAVLAIFLGGLGLGGLLLGKRADRSPNPLRMYAMLELGIASFAALTPLILWAVRAGYLAFGGSFALGSFFSTIVRLVMSVLVIGIPTTLMGGTLPAAIRAVELGTDETRHKAALVYGANTLGAVAGALLSTFFLLERFGNRLTLFQACVLNVIVALAALAASRATNVPADEPATQSVLPLEDVRSDVDLVSHRFVLAAAAFVGFAFLLMELVWYRLLIPILGGTTFTFGLILAVALLGIGLGSFLYALMGGKRVTLWAFALSCSLEALFLAIPFALGDRLAVLALLIRNVGAVGFWGYVLGWFLVTLIIVFPASVVAGVQFPLLIALLGKGRERVGEHVGGAYAWNTIGTILGSIAGGFGLIRILSAPGAWRAVVILLVLLAGLTVLFAALRKNRVRSLLAPVLVGGLAIAGITATGPTAFWRHTPIGAGRADKFIPTPNGIRHFENERRRAIMWDSDGVESSIALSRLDGVAFIVNGKGDGHSRFDAGTQVMGGILAGLLHPRPASAMVIGLGTGSTAGWLGQIPSIQRVDVVEIEPDIVKVAEACSPVNRGVLTNQKVHFFFGDGREFLLTSKQRYDVISSEPSNPYRAGIASLFTKEFYRAAAGRLNEGGVFIQFLQAYEIDSPTLRTVYASITSVFPHVETWQTQDNDLLLVGTLSPLAYSSADLADRAAGEPIRSALWKVWRASTPEAVLAHYVCGTRTAKAIGSGIRPNTDDRTVIEYGFARTLGVFDSFRLADLRDLARSSGDDLPASLASSANREAVEDHRLAMHILWGSVPNFSNYLTPPQRVRGVGELRYIEGKFAEAVQAWISQPRPPGENLEVLSFAESLADAGDERAMQYIDKIREGHSIEADCLIGRLRWRQGRLQEASASLTSAFRAYRTDPWPLPLVTRRAVEVAAAVAAEDPTHAAGWQLYGALEEPFSLFLLNERRLATLLSIASTLSGGICSDSWRNVIQQYEPHVPWQEAILRKRAECYRKDRDPRADQAERDLRLFLARSPEPLPKGQL